MGRFMVAEFAGGRMLPHLLTGVASLGGSNDSVVEVRSLALRANKLEIDLIVHGQKKRAATLVTL